MTSPSPMLFDVSSLWWRIIFRIIFIFFDKGSISASVKWWDWDPGIMLTLCLPEPQACAWPGWAWPRCPRGLSPPPPDQTGAPHISKHLLAFLPKQCGLQCCGSGSGSISQGYGSGSFYHPAKIPIVLWHLLWLFIVEKWCKCTFKKFSSKKFRNYFFFCLL